MVNFFKCIDKISRVLSGCIFLLILLLAVYLQFHYFQKAEEKNVMNLASSWTDENDKPFYRDLDLSKCSCTFTEQNTDDCGKDYVFDNPRIIKFVCKLIDNQGQPHVMELLVK